MVVDAVKEGSVGKNKSHIFNPLPEVEPDRVLRDIVLAFCIGSEDERRIDDTILINIRGEEIDAMFIGVAVMSFGLENPTIGEMKNAAKEYLRRTGHDSMSVVA